MQRIGIGTDTFDLASAAAKIQIDGEQAFEWNGHELTFAHGGEAARLYAAYEAWNDDGKAWTNASLWDATGFTGIDMDKAAVKKTPKKAPKKDPKKGDQ